MIAQLEGTLLYRGLDHIVVSVGGVGFHVIVSLHTLATLTETGKTVRLFTQLHVREDALTLFGFANEDERTAFELCLSVQGVGPKVAMAILSTLEPHALAAAVRQGDHARLQRVPGVAAAGSITLRTAQGDTQRGILRVQVMGYEPGRPGGPSAIASGRGLGGTRHEIVVEFLLKLGGAARRKKVLDHFTNGAARRRLARRTCSNPARAHRKSCRRHRARM